LREKGVKASAETIIKALEGDYRAEHLFTLRQSLHLYRMLKEQIVECQAQIGNGLQGWNSKVDPTDQPPPPARQPIRVEGMTAKEAENLRQTGYRVLGVDLTQMDGLNGNFVPVRLTEVGADLSRFRSSAAFARGLTLCPNPRVTGGKVLKSKTKKGASRLAKAFRMAANNAQEPIALSRLFPALRGEDGSTGSHYRDGAPALAYCLSSGPDGREL
jgi:hypothetical protein